MTQKREYEKDIDEVLEERTYKVLKDDLVATTITLPQVIRAALQRLEKIHDRSWRYASRRTAEHGLSILEHKHTATIKEIGPLRDALLFAKPKKIRNFLMDTKVDIDGLNKPQRKVIALRTELNAAIGKLAESLSIEKSSMIRLCMYYSLATSNELPNEVITAVVSETEEFEEELIETIYMLKLFKSGNEEWLKWRSQF